MKAIGFNAPFKLEDGNQFQEIELNIPEPKGSSYSSRFKV